MAWNLTRKHFFTGLSALGVGAMALGSRGTPSFAVQTGESATQPSSDGIQSTASESAKGVTAETAEFVAATEFSNLPHELVELGKKHILDAIGLAIAGELAETAPLVRRYLFDLGVIGGPATVLGTNIKTAPRFAAFANGVAIHADDFDDTQLAVAKDRVYGLLTHPTVTTLTSSLAMAEALGKSGYDFMLAYHLGLEVATKLAEAIAPRSYETGFHSTSMCGVFGSAASAGKLRGFDASHLSNAFGLAGGQASGLRENFGTMAKPYQAGHGAEVGVVAADLVALGWTAAEDIFEAKRGFFSAFGGGWSPGAIVGKLGRPWSLLSPGVSIKPYPSGSLTHPAMDEVLRLIEINNIKQVDVARIRVGTNKQMLNTLIHHHPKSGLQAKFSMEYCVAVMLVLRRAGLGEYTDDVVRQKDIQDAINIVEFYNNPEADLIGVDKMRSYVEIILKDGRTYSGASDFAKGSPQKPMSFDDTVRKFVSCTTYAKIPRHKADRIVSMIANLEKVEDMGTAFTGMFD
jgi:2-methylcitrate dehydratase PrpD